MELLDAREVAQILRISVPYAYRLMRERRIPTIVLGKNCKRVLKDDLEKYVRKHREAI